MRTLFCFILAFLLTSPAWAASNASSIVAVVNDEIISSLDVEYRTRMVLSATNLSDSPEVRARLAPQILRALIDERLQAQEARNQGIEIGDTETQDGVKTLEQQRGMAPGELRATLENHGIPFSAFLEQIRAQLAWNQLVMKTVRARVKVSDEEIERERAKPKREGQEVQLTLVTLPVERPERDGQVKALAEKLLAETQKGAVFESVARELGGGVRYVDPVWVNVAELDPTLAKAVASATPGVLATPVRTLDGYALVKVLDRRGGAVAGGVTFTEVMFKDLLFAHAPDETRLASLRERIAAAPENCVDDKVHGVSEAEAEDIRARFRRENPEALPKEVQDMLTALPVGGTSPAHADAEGTHVLLLCERMETPAALSDREEATQRLYNQKLELEAQKFLRTLRRDAAIDVRMGGV